MLPTTSLGLPFPALRPLDSRRSTCLLLLRFRASDRGYRKVSPGFQSLADVLFAPHIIIAPLSFLRAVTLQNLEGHLRVIAHSRAVTLQKLEGHRPSIVSCYYFTPGTAVVTKVQGTIFVPTQLFLFFFLFFFNHHFYFPAQLVGGFTLSDLLDKPWSQVSSLLPPGTCLQFLLRIGFSIPTARRFSSNVANSRSRAFR